MHIQSFNNTNILPLVALVEEAPSSAEPSPIEIEEKAHQAFAFPLPIKEKVEIFRSTELLLKKWQQEPTLTCSVSDAYTTQNIDVPLSAIASWHYFQQLYSGGYAEEKREHLSIKLPEEYMIPAFEALCRHVDVQAEGLLFEDVLAICSLGSFLEGTTSMTHLDTFEPSLENIVLLLGCSALPSFDPYKQLASFMISKYICSSLDIESAINNLKSIEGFEEWAHQFPIELDLMHARKMTSSHLSMIGSLFPHTVKLEIFGPNITYLPKEFGNLTHFFANYTKDLEDISALDGSKQLSTLKLHGAPVASLPRNCPFLQEVDIQHCGSIENLEPLNGSTSLKILKVASTPVKAIPENCQALETVIIRSMFQDPISLQPLNNSLTLKVLILHMIHNRTIAPVNCKNLFEVDIFDASITHLHHLGMSRQLKILKLAELPSIRIVPGLCPELEELYLINCPNIETLSIFDGSTKLQKLVFNDEIPSIPLPQNCPNLKIEVVPTEYK